MGKILNVLGVMAGNGVCLYPFHRHPKFNVIGNWEIRGVFYDKKQNQWEANFPNVLQTRQFPRKLSKVDLIIGHPDCGDSSVLRMSRAKKAGEVADNQSITGFFNSITHFKPKVALMENLPGLLKTYSKEMIQELYPEYHIIIHNSSVSHYLNSQVSRKRLVIIWVSKKVDKSFLKYFKLPKESLDALATSEIFEEGVKEIPDICHVREDISKTCNLYYEDKRQITYKEAQFIWLNHMKGSRWHVGGKMNNQPGVSMNQIGQYPFTVRKQNRQFGTTGLVLSPREMANIQGVPKSFKLIFYEGQRNYWINKGRLTVTKTMPYDIANWFKLKVLKLVNNTI